MKQKRLVSLFPIGLIALCSLGQTGHAPGRLTLDDKMQALAERLLEGKQGSIVAIEPSTGEVKCLVSKSFLSDTINRAIGMAYSPGSTFKTAQTLALVSEGIVNKDSKFTCSEGFWKDNIHIGCHKHSSPKDLIGAIAHSCNSWFCKAFMNMIKDRAKYKNKLEAINKWKEYMSSLGLGRPLGIDMEGETGGEMPDSEILERLYNGRWNETTIMWVGMGQGEVLATPLQLCNLAAIIANKGYYYIPHIRKNVDTTYTTRHLSAASPEAFDLVREGMRKAVTTGTATTIRHPDWQICGKTGTAENPGEDHSVFIGYAPMDAPKIAVCVYVENAGFGADLAAPLAQLMTEQYLTGKLSERSERKARQWYDFMVMPYDPTELMEEETPTGSPAETQPAPSATPSKTNPDRPFMKPVGNKQK
ncbi:penicillin-binding protein 2 [Prevotella sp. KH2C16]|uniref:peptidoglycan D,D-transpeptidase FtsI family protein n=1 Tax=Prevotella sp. KH2C16 TaxID=1855325 RepID=UPI0008EE1A08|nr:penicillin-binding transpeptidase domain-containing protein [Prevotella sp. KH2C16]SFF94547.1 penicillin-binding protein 2 [Prevotella sp. KH2C16]